VRQQAADAWCAWESSILEDPPSDAILPLCSDDKAALAFARIVTHYAAHNIWLDDGALLEGASGIAHIPLAMINGENDPQTGRWIDELAGRLPLAQVTWVPDAGHSAREEGFVREIVRALDRFARVGGSTAGQIGDTPR
jgi:proline iminopeptidase